MHGIEEIKAMNEKAGRLPLAEVVKDSTKFQVSQEEAAGVLRGWAYCQDRKYWFGDPEHYYECEACRNVLLGLRPLRYIGGDKIMMTHPDMQHYLQKVADMWPNNGYLLTDGSKLYFMSHGSNGVPVKGEDGTYDMKYKIAEFDIPCLPVMSISGMEEVSLVEL